MCIGRLLDGVLVREPQHVALRTQGVDFVDLTMIFKDEPRTVYRDTCCHLNGLGNRQLATAIAGAILHAADTARDPDASGAPE